MDVPDAQALVLAAQAESLVWRATRGLARSHASPALISAFDALVARVGRFGPVRVDAARTSIHFISDHAFAGVTVRREFLRVSIHASNAPGAWA